ncbi:MAG: Uma2 family endonuclease [Myxococcota bacterium]
MATATESSPTVERRRFTVDEVLQMVEAGILSADEPIELLEGELVVVHPQGPSHRSLTVRVHRRLESVYGAGFHVQDHSPIAVAPDSLPEPDVALIRGRGR